MPKPLQVAIDGPVASGKTVVGKLLARRLGYRFLDTGAMYRAMTWLALKDGVVLEDEPLTQLACRTRIEVVLDEEGNNRILVNGDDVTDELRTRQVDEAVSVVSRVPGLRDAMVAQQRAIARDGPIVMVGRDIGTVVLPQAGLKVYLEALVAERARRRYLELKETGKEVSYDAVLENLTQRDKIDSGRAYAPLRPASDARILHTNHIGVKDVVAEIMSMMEGR